MFLIPLIILLVLVFALGFNNIPPVWIIVLITMSAEILLGWFYSLGSNLYKKQPILIDMNLKMFKICILIAAVYIPFLCNFSLYHKSFDPLQFALGFFAAGCLAYGVFLIAKALKIVELKRPVSIDEIKLDFYALCFYPVGIWIIQPRINKIFNNQDNIF